ncbi:MAG: hypothetical protein AAGJ32_09135 [Pseudomonadota bacterium]
MSADRDKDFFIGWAETPRRDRRFFLGAGLALMAGTGATAAGLAAFQAPVGPGMWDQGTVKTYTGVITAHPYPMLRTRDVTGAPQTALLSCLGKCGVGAQIGALEGQRVEVDGSLIQRGTHAMIAVAETSAWVRPAGTQSPPDPALAIPSRTPVLEAITLRGEILDTKCWFGAMRPSEGKVHKSCAALCIRAGLPPAFFARDADGNASLLIMTNGEAAHGTAILPYVADPVEITGKVWRAGNILYLDAPPSALIRI